ncbi:sialate O-acetylesterase [uncultured Draconibacterium sp.]|uniref:sialate O-acetylesterase n=1 Tax=uncultured Draconibacterium sp. TaxID=1573823 RepID=UPI0025E70154|nr:sialate O-acetylesterase [uncultured Draconibacterium sp.]
MISVGKGLLTLVTCLLFWQCNAVVQNDGDEVKDEQARNLDIYLLIGQSNMAGRATIEGADKDTLKNVFLYTGTVGCEWEKAANPLNKYSTIRKDISMQRLGPGYHFAKTMVELNGKNSIGLVVNAKGGTKIELWQPGGEFYNEAVKRTKAALKYGTLKGILWHQGESNSSKYNEYMPKIIVLIEALRSDLAVKNLPFVAGQLSGDKENRAGFNQMILDLPNKLQGCGVVSSEGTGTIDSTHFDAASQQLLGQRYAQKMFEIQAKQN